MLPNYTSREWVYSVESPASSTRIMSGVSSYPYPSTMSVQQPLSYRSNSIGAYGQSQYPNVSGKPTYPVPYCGDDAINMALHSPPFMLPSQEPMNSIASCPSQDSLRGWGPVTQGNKNGTGLFLDQDSPPSFPNTPISYLNDTINRSPAVVTESANFTLASLASNLPGSSPVADRVILPNPTAGRSQQTSAFGFHNLSTDFYTTSGSSQSYSYNKASSWGNESNSSLSGQESRAASPMKISTSAGASTNGAQLTDSPLAYMPLSTSSEATTATAPALSYTTSGSSFAHSHTSYPSVSSPSDGILSSNGSSSNLYNFSSSYSAGSTSPLKRNSASSEESGEAQLANGQIYTRIREPSQHSTSTSSISGVGFDDLRRPSADTAGTATEVHRGSISNFLA
jgi:hypothetical protein